MIEYNSLIHPWLLKCIEMFYVYLLISQKDGSSYIGQTNDLKKRLIKHNSGRVKSTKSSKPWKIIKRESFFTRKDARWREYTLKHNSSERKKFFM